MSRLLPVLAHLRNCEYEVVPFWHEGLTRCATGRVAFVAELSSVVVGAVLDDAGPVYACPDRGLVRGTVTVLTMCPVRRRPSPPTSIEEPHDRPHPAPSKQ
jgi:hypothetical protein